MTRALPDPRRARRIADGARPTLQRLARLHGVQATYHDGCGRRCRASPDAVRAILGALGAPLGAGRPADLRAATAARLRALWSRPVEPVVVAWRGRRAGFLLRLSEADSRVPVHCRLRLEDGRTRSWTVASVASATDESVVVDGTRYGVRRVALPAGLPLGYHDLHVEIGRRTWRALTVAAPLRAWDDGAQSWGAFLPLHALHSTGSWGVGDFTDLDSLARWVGSCGGRSIGVLPLLAAFLGERPFEPSPYLPVSRTFWNELHVDPRRLPEFEPCEPAKRLVASRAFRHRVEVLRAAPLVDYREAMTLRRRVLELLAGTLDDGPARRREAFRTWVQRHPVAQEYAAFRAIGERLERPWPAWPSVMPPGEIRVEPADRDAMRYHLYAQWAAAGQIAQLAADAGARGVGLYLDLPVGVHPDGFDVWRRPALFARDAALGAPPDPLFAEGQDWSAPPPHPDAARLDRYTYFRASLGHQMAHATAVRLDHVMGLHRLFWIPRGGAAEDGAYVHYPADELYAIVCLESHRHRTRVVGENLGTVPRTVNAALSRHGLARLHVVQFGIAPGAAAPLARVPRRAFACVNTHDTPTFAGFLAARDIDERVERGVLDGGRARDERGRRQAASAALRRALASASRAPRGVDRPAPRMPAGGAAGTGADSSRIGNAPSRSVSDGDLLSACLARLARSVASVVIVNLEDLWREAQPQNVPGTGPEEHPNWRRRARYGLEVFRRLPEVAAALRGLARGAAHRRRGVTSRRTRRRGSG